MKNILLLSLCIGVILSSCKDEYNICNEPKTVKFIASVYQKNGSVDVLTAVPNFTLINITGNIPIYTSEPNLNTFNFSLNNLLDSAQYVISLANNLPKDTLTVLYTTTGATATSLDCGPLFNHKITKLYSTKNTIDSIVNVNAILNSSLALNAKLYF